MNSDIFKDFMLKLISAQQFITNNGNTGVIRVFQKGSILNTIIYQ